MVQNLPIATMPWGFFVRVPRLGAVEVTATSTGLPPVATGSIPACRSKLKRSAIGSTIPREPKTRADARVFGIAQTERTFQASLNLFSL